MQRPPKAEPNTWEIATLRNDDAVYGRSLTYCCKEKPSPAFAVTSLTFMPRAERHVPEGRIELPTKGL